MCVCIQFLDCYGLMMVQVVAENGRRIFIKLCCLCLEILYIFVVDTATGIFHTKFLKFSCPSVRCRHLPTCRYIAVGQFGKNLLALAFGISSVGRN